MSAGNVNLDDGETVDFVLVSGEVLFKLPCGVVNITAARSQAAAWQGKAFPYQPCILSNADRGILQDGEPVLFSSADVVTVTFLAPEEDEDLEDIPVEEKHADAFMYAKIEKDGFQGQVEDIERSKVTKEKLYRIKYLDGDLEHFTAAHVQKFMENVKAPKGKAKAKAKRAVVEANEEDDACEDAVEPTPIMKKPAAAAKRKAKAAPAVQKSIAKKSPKASGKAAVLKKPARR